MEKAFIPWFADEYTEQAERNGEIPDYLTLTPQDIKKELEKNVVNQEEACRKIAVMMYQHLQGHRFVGLLAGPTGSGKSFIAQNLKDTFPDLVYIRDISNLTQEGWKGDKKVSTLLQDVHNPIEHNGKIYPLVFLDECDKLFSPQHTSGGENVSASVQSELLTVIHGGEIQLPDRRRGFLESENTSVMDTSKISFLFAGAFEKRAKQIAEDESGASIGFGASHEKKQSYNRDLTMEDVCEAGCITELCGRIQKLVCLNKFDEASFLEMLNYKDRGPVHEIEMEFGIPIRISKRKQEELAHDAYVSGLGIRGMKNAIREYMDELTWVDCHAKVLEIV